MSRIVVLALPLMVAALVAAVSICSPRAESILRQSEAALGQTPAARDKASSASVKASSGSFLMKREQPHVLPTDWLKEQNGQDRPRERLGKKKDGFVHVQDHTAEERRAYDGSGYGPSHPQGNTGAYMSGTSIHTGLLSIRALYIGGYIWGSVYVGSVYRSSLYCPYTRGPHI